MKTTKFLAGWYRLTGEHHFSNIKLENDGLWSADLRYQHSGELVRYAGLWSTKREAVDEATYLISRHDALFVPVRD